MGSSAQENRKTQRLLLRWDFLHDESIEKAINFETMPLVTDLSLLKLCPIIRVETPYSVQNLNQQEVAD